MESQFGMSEAIGGCNCSSGGAMMRMPKKNTKAVKKAAPKKPVTKKPVTKKPATKKPATKKTKK